MDNYKKNLNNNIFNITAVIALRNFILFMAVIVPFFESLGLNFLEIMLIEMSFALTVLIMEIPSGYIADKFGRKNIIIVGTFASFLGVLNYSFANSFEFFLISEILIGIGCSFISGADGALLYDSLIELKRTKEYKKIEGKREAVRVSAIAFSALLSGFFAIYSFRLNFYITAIIAFFSFIFALKLTETKNCCSSNLPELKFIKVLKETMHQKELLLIIIFSAVIYGLSNAHFLMSQKFLTEINYPLAYIGILFALANFFVAGLALIAHKIESKIGLINSMILTAITVGGSFILFGLFNTAIGILGIFTYQFARGIRTPILKDFINNKTTSERRATILSIDGFIGRGLFVIISPIIGFLAITYGFNFSTTILGITLFIILLITIILFKKKSII